MGGAIHALSLDTPTPEEWARARGLKPRAAWTSSRSAAAAVSRARCAPRAPRTRRCRSSQRDCSPTRRSRCATSRGLHDVKTMIRLLGGMGVTVDAGRGRHGAGRCRQLLRGDRALRPRQDDARVDPRPRPAVGAPRRGARVAAGRLRDRRAAGEPARLRARGDGRRDLDRERLHPRKGRAPARRARSSRTR